MVASQLIGLTIKGASGIAYDAAKARSIALIHCRSNGDYTYAETMARNWEKVAKWFGETHTAPFNNGDLLYFRDYGSDPR